MDKTQLIKHYNEPSHKYNIISVSVFRLQNNYKSTETYYNGLKKLSKSFRKYLPEFYLRVHYDTSITQTNNGIELIDKENKDKWIPLLEEMKKDKYIQLVEYNYDDFKSGNFHEGVFGTFVRFMPLFDYADNNTNIVYVSDIDINDYVLDQSKKVYEIFKKSESLIHYRSKYCYTAQPRFTYADNNLDPSFISNIPYKIMVGTLLTKFKLPRQLLDDFINCMKDLDVKECNYIKNFTNIKNTKGDVLLDNYMLNNKKGETSNFFYGIDEFFFNTIVLKYMENNRIPFSITISVDIFHPIYNNYMRSFAPLDDPNNKKLLNPSKHIKRLYRAILGKYYDDNKTLQENYTYMDKILYNIHRDVNTDRKQKYEYIYKKFRNIIKRMYEKNKYEKYNFTKKEILCVLDVNDKEKYGYLFKNYDYNTNSLIL